MTLPTIHQLRLAGFKVKLDHYRRVQLPAIGSHPTLVFSSAGLIPANREWHSMRVTRLAKKAREFLAIDPRGGRTELYIRTPDGKEGKAVALCNPADRFYRRRANAICIGRLVKAGVIPAKLEVAS